MAPWEANMKQLNETEIKYLAGLMDADGSLFFQFVPYKDVYNVRLILNLQLSDSSDKDGRYIRQLADKLGVKAQVIDLTSQNPNWSCAYRLRMTNQATLNMLLPRLIKHMVIKAKHWETLRRIHKNLINKSVSYENKVVIENVQRESRSNVGPLKSKLYPTSAWLAGFLDGDGCYHMRTRSKNGKNYKELLIKVTVHTDDRSVLEFIHNKLGGRYYESTNENTYNWVRNLGPKDRSFAVEFLRKMHKHSQLKKHKIEQMLHYHSQRLTDSNPKG